MDPYDLWKELDLGSLLQNPRLLKSKNLNPTQLDPLLKHDSKWKKPNYNVLKGRYNSVPTEPIYIKKNKIDRLADPLRGKYSGFNKLFQDNENAFDEGCSPSNKYGSPSKQRQTIPQNNGGFFLTGVDGGDSGDDIDIYYNRCDIPGPVPIIRKVDANVPPVKRRILDAVKNTFNSINNKIAVKEHNLPGKAIRKCSMVNPKIVKMKLKRDASKRANEQDRIIKIKSTGYGGGKLKKQIKQNEQLGKIIERTSLKNSTRDIQRSKSTNDLHPPGQSIIKTKKYVNMATIKEDQNSSLAPSSTEPSNANAVKSYVTQIPTRKGRPSFLPPVQPSNRSMQRSTTVRSAPNISLNLLGGLERVKQFDPKDMGSSAYQSQSARGRKILTNNISREIQELQGIDSPLKLAANLKLRAVESGSISPALSANATSPHFVPQSPVNSQTSNKNSPFKDNSTIQKKKHIVSVTSTVAYKSTDQILEVLKRVELNDQKRFDANAVSDNMLALQLAKHVKKVGDKFEKAQKFACSYKDLAGADMFGSGSLDLE